MEERMETSAQALATAIRTGDLPTVTQLIDADRSLREAVVGRRGVTPVNLAVIEGQLEVLRYLVESHCDVDHTDVDLFNCAHLAAWYDHWHIIEYLGAIRPSQMRSRTNGNLPIHIAAYRKMYRALLSLSKYSDINQQDKNLNTPLRIFIQQSDVEGVRTCLQARARVRNIDINTIRIDKSEFAAENREILRLLHREKDWENRKGLIMLVDRGMVDRMRDIGRLPRELVTEIVLFL